MALIGEELRTILGMMPVRDRAGIARGTMADDAVRANAAAESGNAEGAALMQQGMRPAAPPDIQLPPEIGTAYASGRGDGVPPSAPVPTERVVAASPAAAPSQAVATQASDVMLATLEQRARQAKMMQLVGSLGMIANAFNRNPSSQSATRSSLAGMVGGGGGEIGIPEIKAIADMKEREAAQQGASEARTSGIGALVKRGLSPAEAAVEYDSGQYKQRIGAEADEKAAERERATTMRTNLMKPDAVQEIMKRTGMPQFQVEAEIQNGKILDKIDPKILADIAEKQSQTVERQQKTQTEAGEIQSYENAKNNRAKFMEQYDLSPTAADRALANRKSYDQFVSDRSGAKTAGIQGFEYDRARAREAGKLAEFDKKFPDLPTYEKLKVPGLETPESKASAAGLVKDVTNYSDIQIKAANQTKKNLEVTNHSAQDRWTPNLITGAGEWSVRELKGRKLSAQLLGYSDDAVGDTQLFFNERKANALKMRGTDMPGAMSDGDREFLTEIAGNEQMDAKTLRRLLTIQEKYHRAELVAHNEDVRVRKEEDPETWKHLREVKMPGPGRFVKEDLATPAGKQMLQQLYDNPTNPEAKRLFDEGYGKGMSDYYLARKGK